mgnify:CR=1 FL=1
MCMKAKKFLQLAGMVLVILAILGFVGVIGPDARTSIFGARWYFDNGENWAYLIIGVIVLVGSVVLSTDAARTLTKALAAIALLFGLYGIFISTNFLGSSLQNPADTILHLVLGICAIWASKSG